MTALIYPLVITTVGAAAIVFLMTFVIPRFATIFADLGQAIPLPTQILLSVSAAIQSYWWVGAIVHRRPAILAWRVWTSTPQGRLAWDQTILRLPLVGAPGPQGRDGALRPHPRHDAARAACRCSGPWPWSAT